jgi:hypothetical protein
MALLSENFRVLRLTECSCFGRLPCALYNTIFQSTASRNLVTSLFEHEQIKTTLPKARETARMAEKVALFAAYAARRSQP